MAHAGLIVAKSVGQITRVDDDAHNSERRIMSSNTRVVAYKNAHEASLAVDHLVAAGIKPDEISVLMSDKTHDTHFAVNEATKAPEGGATGAAIGGTLGAIGATAAAAAGVVIPGVGFLAAGPIMTALAGLGAGAAAGGAVGGLVGFRNSRARGCAVREGTQGRSGPRWSGDEDELQQNDRRRPREQDGSDSHRERLNVPHVLRSNPAARFSDASERLSLLSMEGSPSSLGLPFVMFGVFGRGTG